MLLVSLFMLISTRGYRTFADMLYIWLVSGAGIFSFLPGVLGFYFFYGLLFTRFLQTKKFGALLLFGLSGMLSSGVITLLMLSIPGTWVGRAGWQEKMWMTIFLALLAGIHGVV